MSTVQKPDGIEKLSEEDLVEKLRDKGRQMHEREIKKIKGLAYLNKKGQLKETGFRELIQDLDEVPMIPYEKLNLKFYFRPEVTHIYYFFLSASSFNHGSISLLGMR